MKKYLSILLLFVSCYCWGQTLSGSSSYPTFNHDSSSITYSVIYENDTSFPISKPKLNLKKKYYSEYIKLKRKGISDSNNKYFKLLNKK